MRNEPQKYCRQATGRNEFSPAISGRVVCELRSSVYPIIAL
jgi:hypothetical protein